MADESRLYAKLTLDFADSHKIAPLSDAAFRAYIRMLLWSRRMLTDGKIPGRMALFFAKPKVLEELSTNDPESPSLRRDGDDFFIHDFAEHQSTKAEIEAQRERNAANGRKGGQARAKRVASKSLSENEAGAKPSSGENVATFNTETETETETTPSDEGVPRKRSSRIPKNFTITDDMRAWAKAEVPLVNVDAKLSEFVDYWVGVPGQKGVKADWVSTWRNSMRKQQQFAERDLAVRPARVDETAWMNA